MTLCRANMLIEGESPTILWMVEKIQPYFIMINLVKRRLWN